MHRSRPRQNIHDDWLYRDGLHFIAEVFGWLWLLTSQDTWRSTVSCIEAFILSLSFLLIFRFGVVGGGGGVGKRGAKRWWAEKGIGLRTINDHACSGYP